MTGCWSRTAIRSSGAWLVALTACVGQIGENDHVAAGSDALECAAVRPGRSPVRRLVRLEYNNTVRDLLGDTTRPADDFVAEEQALGFDNNADALNASQLLVEQYESAAEALSVAAVLELPGLLQCDPVEEGEDTCAQRFVSVFGRRAYRRPLAAAEADRLYAFFAARRTEYDFATGIRLTLKAMLQSPHFLYRLELGMPDPSAGGGGVRRLGPFELASRLSYLLWSTMPDEELLATAESGQLETSEQVAAQARRMLEDGRARDAIARFHAQWLELEGLGTVSKDPEMFPAYTPEIPVLARLETERFVEHVVLEGDGSLRTMLGADYTFLDETLAAFYGVAGPTGSEMQKTALDPTQRAGLLTHASLLASLAKPTQSSPVLRGKFIRERMLCETLPPPPPNVDTTPPEVDPLSTTRERFAQHTEDPVCADCHVRMDPIGFGFEHYDAVGRWRDDENGLPIDATGEIVGMSGSEATFDGVPELAELLAESEQVRSCLVRQWFRYAYGRAERDDDTCTLEQLRSSFTETDANIRELLVALTQTDAFLFRTMESGGAQ